MKNNLFSFLNLLKNIFLDIFVLYKNFIHWNVSKVLVIISSFLVGVLLSLPFFLIMGILALIDPIEWTQLFSSDINIYLNIANYVSIHPFYILIEFIVFALGLISLFLGMSYHVVLESNLYLHYFKKEKLPYKGNHYFDAPRIYTYFGILAHMGLYLLLPFAALLLIFIILFLLFKFLFLPEAILALLLFVGLVVCGIWFLYLSYRLTFSYLVFVDDENYGGDKKAKSYVKKSLEITKGKIFFKFLGVFIVFTILLAPFNIINLNIETGIQDIRDYFGYKSGQIQIASQGDQYNYEYLQSLFSNTSDEVLVSDLKTLYIQQVIYTLFFFLLIAGVFPMMLACFYKRALTLQWSRVKDSEIKGKKPKKLKKEKKVSKKTNLKKKETKKKETKKSVKKKTK